MQTDSDLFMAYTSRSQTERPPRSLLAPPAAGSANPAVSLESLWSYIQPALDHLLLKGNKDGLVTPPALEPAYHMGIHTMIYNYFTSQSNTSTHHSRYNKYQDSSQTTTSGWDERMANSPPDLYLLLDRYLQSTVQEIFQTTPGGGEPLVRYYVAQFEHFAAGMQSIHRLLNYINRHYVKRAQDEDRGWLRIIDVLDGKLTKSLATDGQLTRSKLTEILNERRLKELVGWGYDPEDGEESATSAEACAEAASPPERIIHINAMGFRRWRIEMIEPLLAIPKVGVKPTKGGGSNKTQSSTKRPPALMSRLSRAVQEVLDSDTLTEQERRDLVEKLDDSLRLAGLRRDHQMRKRLHRSLVLAAPGRAGRPKQSIAFSVP